MSNGVTEQRYDLIWNVHVSCDVTHPVKKSCLVVNSAKQESKLSTNYILTPDFVQTTYILWGLVFLLAGGVLLLKCLQKNRICGKLFHGLLTVGDGGIVES